LKGGLADLDASGTWIQTSEYGTVWKPNAPAGWVPFRNGRWIWYDTLGYTWISGDPWGWLPYHYGRWMQQETVGWFWVPGKDATFAPGDVYWLRGGNLAGWGPLAPRETWSPGLTPRLFLNVYTTFARFAPGDRHIDPATFPSRPKEPLATVSFVPGLPSPALVAARFDARRPALRAGSTRVVPHVAGISYEPPAEVAHPVPAPPPPVAAPAAPALETVAIPPEPQQPLVVAAPQPEPPMEVYYPAPVYTGIVVVNPPERRSRNYKRHPNPRPSIQPAKPPAAAAAPAEPERAKPIPRRAEDLRPHRSRGR
jgi:hypothetical protein